MYGSFRIKSLINDESQARQPCEPRPQPFALPGPVLVVDPSLFTTPYDEALVAALLELGLPAILAGRPLRSGEAVPSVPFRAAFYRRFDAAPRRLGWPGGVLKAIEHVVDSMMLADVVRRSAMLAHFQWLPLPLADAVFLRLLGRRGPVVVTVHDTTAFNDAPTSSLQTKGVAAALRGAHRLIVHTASGGERLATMGLDGRRIRVVPHGPLGGSCARVGAGRRGPRYTLVAFGKIRPYKGLDLLVEALARCPAAVRDALTLIVAGEPKIDLGPLCRQITAAGLAATVDIRAHRHSEAEMDALFEEADAFVFPYRVIEASGVFYRVQGLGRWVVASRLGAFAESIEEGVSGRLVAPGDVTALSRALVECADRRPRPTRPPRVTDWPAIAAATSKIYQEAWAEWAGATQRREGSR